ncbi:hypothetical protein GCWU000342_02287 [Shuttleworthella satelles DSM 14600]|uniref:Uncharacterized protein n=1 Tax=Shuttleworthella satelles DSM 14600 TaxID=626523 RepID=C4GDW3_9FIRM|nr:hypothetical protein GCWU000342_02287 [Shuttleworthia satelles DSM 14600]
MHHRNDCNVYRDFQFTRQRELLKLRGMQKDGKGALIYKMLGLRKDKKAI